MKEMMISTKELEGWQLDWAVAQVTGVELDIIGTHIGIRGRTPDGWPKTYSPSTDWSQGGPLLESRPWALPYRSPGHRQHMGFFSANTPGQFHHHGPTPLIAAMRAIVAAEFGEEIDIPDQP